MISADNEPITALQLCQPRAKRRCGESHFQLQFPKIDKILQSHKKIFTRPEIHEFQIPIAGDIRGMKRTKKAATVGM